MARKKAAPVEEPEQEPKTWKKSMLLDVALTTAELLERSRELRAQREALVQFKEQRDRTVKVLDATMKEMRARVDCLDVICLDGTEAREVEVVLTLRKATPQELEARRRTLRHDPELERATVDVVRSDTGALVESRIPHWQEIQGTMFDEDDFDDDDEDEEDEGGGED